MAEIEEPGRVSGGFGNVEVGAEQWEEDRVEDVVEEFEEYFSLFGGVCL